MLKLTKITAFTVNSSDSEYRSSNKGVYRDYVSASNKCKGSGWYGSDGTVENLDNIYIDEGGEIYTVNHIGKFTDDEEKHRKEMIESIKTKLTDDELKFVLNNKIKI